MGRTRSRSRRSSGYRTESTKARRPRSSKRTNRGTKRKRSDARSDSDSDGDRSIRGYSSDSESGYSSDSKSGYSSDSRSGYSSDASSESDYIQKSKSSVKPKFKTLKHNGPLFPPPYQPLPSNVKLSYRGKRVSLSPEAEELAGFYAKLLGTSYTKSRIFNTNFFEDFRGRMSTTQRNRIHEFKYCDFREIRDHLVRAAERKKQTTPRVKTAKDERNDRKYRYCLLDGREQRISKPDVEPPGIFIGRGEISHRGRVKARIQPEDVTINCSRGSTPKPPRGHRWGGVQHDHSVTWLARWQDTVLGSYKYIQLDSSSGIKTKSDLMKYEKARDLATKIDSIRKKYLLDCRESKGTTVRQRATAMYFIDKLALRAGNEKSSDLADTVGCCSLRKEHLKLFDRKDGKKWVVAFDFLGKDSIQFKKEVAVPEKIFQCLQDFIANKRRDDKVFDRLDTGSLNAHLSSLMDGLTVKVFRTSNASVTLEKELDKNTPRNGTVAEKLLAYTRANREVALLCNHKRAVPKSFEKAMQKMDERIELKKDRIDDIEQELRRLDKDASAYRRKLEKLEQEEEALDKLEIQKSVKESGKDIALGTSKLNYLDPRITVAWCEKYGVPIDKIYSPKQREKFAWAINSRNKRNFRFV